MAAVRRARRSAEHGRDDRAPARRRRSALADPAGARRPRSRACCWSPRCARAGRRRRDRAAGAGRRGGIVLALFVLVPRGAGGARRHPALLVGARARRRRRSCCSSLTGFFGDGALPLRRCRTLVRGAAAARDRRAGRARRAGPARRRPAACGSAAGRPDAVAAADRHGRRPAPAPVARARRAGAGRALPPSSRSASPAPAAAMAVRACCRAAAAARLALIAVTPLLIAGFARADRARVDDAREDERRRVAAHLHDSVLQTLALVQRQAHDPAAVARLARRQEHELRAWMAGEVELGSETLGAALRDGGRGGRGRRTTRLVELTILGDRRLDRETEALAAAAREALRNAARHAPGAPIFVFAQARRRRRGGVRARRGPGLRAGGRADRAARRARLDHRADGGRGRAARSVESRPGEGTEVALRIGVVDDAERCGSSSSTTTTCSAPGVRAELAAHHDVVGEAATPAEALAVIAATQPDVVLLDVHLPDGGGVAVLEALARAGGAEGARAVGLRRRRGRRADDPRGRARLRDQDDRHRRAAEPRSRPSRPARRASARGWRRSCCRRSRRRRGAPSELEALTPREREVLHHLARGYSYKRIARAARDQRPHRRVPRRRRPAQAPAHLPPRGLHWAATRGLVRRGALTTYGPAREDGAVASGSIEGRRARRQ